MEPKDRMTMPQLLSHKWLKETNEDSESDDEEEDEEGEKKEGEKKEGED